MAFLKDNRGQDLAEYCMLAALVCLIALGILLRVNGGINGIWASANTTVAAGATAATNGAPASSTANHPAASH